MIDKLAARLRLSREELMRAGLLCFLFFLLINGIFFGRNARDSIFLVKVGLAKLPYAYMLNAALAIASSFIYSMFVDKIDRFRLVRYILGIFIALLIVTFGLLQTDLAVFYWTTYSIVQVIWLMSLMMFWTFAADFFDAVQSKRIFPMIGIGGLIGMITSGLVAKPLVKMLGTEKLFIAWAMLLAAAIGVVMTLYPLRPKAAKPARRKTTTEKGQWEQFMEGVRNVRQTPLLLNMVVLILALWLVFTLIDYQFNQVARERFPIKDDLTAFLGIFRSWAGGCCLIFQLFLTPLVIRKLGVSGAMTLHPAFLVLSIGGMAATFGFWPTCVTKFGDHVLLYTATDVAYQLLFNPIPIAQRGRARAFVEGYIKPFSMGLAGAALLILVQLKLSPAQIAACNLFLAVVWLVSALMLKKNYLKAVVSNLQVTQSGASLISALSTEETSEANIQVMGRRLASKNPDDVIFAIEFFTLARYAPAVNLCAPLADHPHTEIRRMATRLIAELGGAADIPKLERALRDRDSGVVREALAGIRRLGGEEQLPVLGALHLHPDMSIVAEGIETAAEVGGFDGILGTADMLKRWSKSEDPRELVLLASVLGRLRIKSFLPVLLDLVKHSNPLVSRTAIEALTAFKDERAMPLLADALRDDILFPQIQRYFIACGEKYRETIQTLYRQRLERHRVRQRFLDAIGRSTKWNTAPLLADELKADDPVIRFLCMKYLSERSGALQQELLAEVLKKEIEYWLRLETLRDKLIPSGGSPRARAAIDLVFGEEILRTRKTIFFALGFLKDKGTLQRIYRNAFYGAPNERALAIEALENIGIDPWVSILMPILTENNIAEARTLFLKLNPQSRFDIQFILEDLVRQSYDYVLTAILYAWRESRDDTHVQMIESLKSHSSSLVREHAEAARAAMAIQGG